MLLRRKLQHCLFPNLHRCLICVQMLSGLFFNVLFCYVFALPDNNPMDWMATCWPLKVGESSAGDLDALPLPPIKLVGRKLNSLHDLAL